MPTRKSYAGAAVPTTISSGAFGIGATTFTLTVATGWPTTAGGPFVATIDRGAATEEHVLVAARAGTTCSSVTRGYAGTSEVAHASGATIEHRWDSTSADEANRIASLMTTKGDTLGHDGTQPQREPVGTSGYLYTATPAAATGHSWTAPPSSLVSAKGQLLGASAAATLTNTPTPATNQILVGDTTQTSGWGLQTLPVIHAATAPTSPTPVAGDLWYDTTTFTLKQYTTATTGWQKPWGQPWGRIAGALDTTPRSSSINSGAGLVVFPTLSFSPLANRLYKVTYHASRVEHPSNAGETLIVQVCDQAGVVIQNLAVFVGIAATAPFGAVMADAQWTTAQISGLQVRATSTYSVATNFQVANYAAYLVVEDTGPAAVPA